MLIVIGVIFIALSLYAIFIEPRWVKLRRHRIIVPGIQTVVRLGFAADIHGDFRAVERIATTFAGSGVDAVVLGGDYNHRGRAPSGQSLEEFAGKLLRPLIDLDQPTMAVLGNHDLWPGTYSIEVWKSVLTGLGITLLADEAVSFPIDNPQLQLVGLTELETSPAFSCSQNFIDRRRFRQTIEMMAELRVLPDLPVVLLTHNPDGVWRKTSEQVVAVLSGHTHGGQIIGLGLMPNWFWQRINYFACPRGSFGLWSGVQTVNQTTLITSNGASGRPRLCRRPEVHIHDLLPN